MQALTLEIESRNYKFIYLEDIKAEIIILVKDKVFSVKDFLLHIFISEKIETKIN